jgi:hypothetical protein
MQDAQWRLLEHSSHERPLVGGRRGWNNPLVSFSNAHTRNASSRLPAPHQLHNSPASGEFLMRGTHPLAGVVTVIKDVFGRQPACGQAVRSVRSLAERGALCGASMWLVE